MGKDPSEFWYQGEISFFQNYVIPLAKKLKECGVFGVSSDEYLNYAENNCVEWKERGHEILKDMVREVDMMVIPVFESKMSDDSDDDSVAD